MKINKKHIIEEMTNLMSVVPSMIYNKSKMNSNEFINNIKSKEDLEKIKPLLPSFKERAKEKEDTLPWHLAKSTAIGTAGGALAGHLMFDDALSGALVGAGSGLSFPLAYHAFGKPENNSYDFNKRLKEKQKLYNNDNFLKHQKKLEENDYSDYAATSIGVAGGLVSHDIYKNKFQKEIEGIHSKNDLEKFKEKYPDYQNKINNSDSILRNAAIGSIIGAGAGGTAGESREGRPPATPRAPVHHLRGQLAFRRPRDAGGARGDQALF